MFCLIKIGALTSKVYTFMERAWELEKIESIDYLNIIGSTIYIEINGLKIIRIMPRVVFYKYSEWITDMIRFSYDVYDYNRLNFFLKKNCLSTLFNIYLYMIYDKIISFFYFYYIHSFIKNYKNFFLKKNLFYINLTIILGENCDFFFIKSICNLSSFINIFLCKFDNLFFTFLDLYILNIDLFKNFDIIFLIGINMRMENPLLLFLLNFYIKQKNLKIYSLYTLQIGFLYYKYYAFSFLELVYFYFFREKYFVKFFFKNKFKLKIKQLSLFYLLSNKLNNVINFMDLYIFFFGILLKYFNIIYKILNDFLYILNYLFIINTNNISNLTLSNKNNNNNKFYDNLYVDSYPILIWFYNCFSWFFIKKSIDLVFYYGSFGNYLQLYYFDIIFPITFFFEMDSLYYNIFGLLLTGKFIKAPELNIYESLDFFGFFFKKDVNYFFFKCLNFFFNKKYFISFFNKVNYIVNFFIYEISTLLYDYVIINYSISLYKKFYNFSYYGIISNMLDIFKTLSLLNSKNLNLKTFFLEKNYYYYF